MVNRRQFLAGAGAVCFTAVAGCLGDTAPSYSGGESPTTKWWPRPQFDSISTCYNPRPVGPRSEVRERWQLDISSPSARPVVADGLAFLPTATAVRAVDVKTGNERWREATRDPPSWPRTVIWHDGTLYVAVLNEPSLLALDGKTGTRQWQFAPDEDDIHALSMDPDGRTLFAGGHGTVSALDPATGERRWHRDVFGVVTDFAIGVGQLLVGTEAGEVYSLSTEDGSGYWRRKFPGSIEALATMYGSFNGAGTFVSVFGGPIFALNSGRTGATVWKADVWGSGSFVVAGRTLFAAGARLVALDIASGEKRWSGDKTTQCGPAGADETVYAASQGHVTAYEFDGGIGVGGLRLSPKRWSYPVKGRPEQGFAVADDAVFFLTEGGENSSKAYALEETSPGAD